MIQFKRNDWKSCNIKKHIDKACERIILVLNVHLLKNVSIYWCIFLKWAFNRLGLFLHLFYHDNMCISLSNKLTLQYAWHLCLTRKTQCNLFLLRTTKTQENEELTFRMRKKCLSIWQTKGNLQGNLHCDYDLTNQIKFKGRCLTF